MRVIALLLFALFCAPPALAGTTGIVKGRVTEVPSGAPWVHGLVDIQSAEQQEVTYTDDHGYFVFMSLAPGTYRILPYGIRSGMHEPYVLVSADTILTHNMLVWNCVCDSWFGGVVNYAQNTARVTQLDMFRVNEHTVPFYGTADLVNQQLQYVPGVRVGQ